MIPNNFNLLRLFAALIVLYGHGYSLQGPITSNRLNHDLGVHIFFAISGYLIASSWKNDPHLLRYFWRRSLRIFPALTFAVLLSITVLGPLMTTLENSVYWQHNFITHYFYNILLYVNYYLPGVFPDNNIAHIVNGSLWTLPVEFFMYITVALLGTICMNNRWVCLAFFALWLSLGLGWDYFKIGDYVIYGTLVKPMAMLAAIFWSGVCINRWGIDKYFSLNSFVLVFTLWIFTHQWQVVAYIMQYFALPFLVLCFGMANAGSLNFFNRADYSYGVYIYAFPIQQTLIALFPSLPVLVSIVLCTLCTLLLAAFSWHTIEKPLLRFKPKRTKPSAIQTKAMSKLIKEAT